MKKLGLTILIAAFSLLLVACNSGEKDAATGTEITTTPEVKTDLAYANDVTENPTATITMENGGEIVIELMPKVAPNSVLNFISLAQSGFYDGVIFHRVIPGFMIQGGDPTGTGSGGPGYSIDGEFTANGFENTLVHERGVISMARTSEPNSAGSQFFIMVENSPHLDGEYAAFGKVLSGMEVADAIVAADRNSNNKPLEDQKIKSVTIDTKGFTYPKPNTNK